MKTCKLFFLILTLSACNAATNSAPPQDPGDAAQDTALKNTSKVVWIQASDGSSFWETVKSNDRTVALFGASYCEPCNHVQFWWEKHPAPAGWQFVYWDVEKAHDDFSSSLKDLLTRDNNVPYVKLPVINVIEQRETPEHTRSFITAQFRDYRGCTEKTLQFLDTYPQGTLPF